MEEWPEWVWSAVRVMMPFHPPARVAEEKAEALLLSWLTPSQRYEWEASEQFAVTGSCGGEYIITKGTIYNVIAVDGGKMCFRPQIPTGGMMATDWPVCDILLAQKLALEHDEAYVLKVANRNDSIFDYPYSRHQTGWSE